MNPFSDYIPSYIPSWQEYQASMPYALMDLSSTSSSSSNSSGTTPQPDFKPIDLAYQVIGGAPIQHISGVPLNLIPMNFQAMPMSFPLPVMDTYRNAAVEFPPLAPTVDLKHNNITSADLKHSLSHYPNASARVKTPYKQNGKARRTRTQFTDVQSEKLQAEFEVSIYSDPKRRDELAKEIGLNSQIIAVWFKNQRSRQRQQQKGTSDA